MKKFTIATALKLFGFEGGIVSSVAALKSAYRQFALQTHPDRGGDTVSMQDINAAFAVLKKHGLEKLVELREQSSSDRNDWDWLWSQNEGHPLYSSDLPCFYSLDTLLKKTYSLRTKEAGNLPGFYPGSEYDKNRSAGYTHFRNKAYFQAEGRDFCLEWWDGGSGTVDITDVTEAGRTGKLCRSIRFSVGFGDWPSDWPDNSRLISNVIRDDNWDWAEEFNLLMGSMDAAVKNAIDAKLDRASFKYRDAEFTSVRERFGDLGDYWKGTLNGVVLTISCSSTKSVGVVNPYTLQDVYKRVKEAPGNGTVSVVTLIKLLVNGQFRKLKRNYYYTDDYAFDAAYGFREGMYENPIPLVHEWINSRGSSRGCARVYSNGSHVSFGFHSNDSSGLSVELNNALPLEDVLPADMSLENVVAKLSMQPAA